MARQTKVNLEEMANEMDAIEQTEVKTEETPVDPWKIMVPLYIPRANYGNSNRVETFSVNNIAWNVIWNGTKQEIPKPIAEIVQTVLNDRYAEEDAIRDLPQDAVNPNPGVAGRNF